MCFAVVVALDGEVQQCQNGDCDLYLDLEMISKFTGHEISISIAEFRFAPRIGALLVVFITFPKYQLFVSSCARPYGPPCARPFRNQTFDRSPTLS